MIGGLTCRNDSYYTPFFTIDNHTLKNRTLKLYFCIFNIFLIISYVNIISLTD